MKVTLPLAFCLTFACGAGAQNSIPLFKPGALRVLVLSGRNNHDWRATTPAIRNLLVGSGRFDVRVNEEPAGMSEDTLAAYDAVVLDYNGPRWGAGAEKALESFVRGGKGLVVVHGASWAFSGLEVLGDNHVRTGIMEPAWPEYARMIGGVWSLESPKTGHGRRHVFQVRIVDHRHPVSDKLPDTLEANDELYHELKMQPNVHVLGVAFDDPATGGTSRDEPILWTVNYGRGRVFHTTLGHDPAAMAEPAFALPFLRGTEWVATGAEPTLSGIPAGAAPGSGQVRR